MSKPTFKFRDVSKGLKRLRDFLLGRKHTLHGRFSPVIAPRTIPPADVPRGVNLKYSEQYYFERNPMDSVKPPVVGPIAEGLAKGGKNNTSCATEASSICFDRAPTPGPVWMWDGHCFYQCTPEPRKPEETTCDPKCV